MPDDEPLIPTTWEKAMIMGMTYGGGLKKLSDLSFSNASADSITFTVQNSGTFTELWGDFSTTEKKSLTVFIEEPGCNVFWGSHGCDMEFDHDPAHIHRCGAQDPDGPCCELNVLTNEVRTYYESEDPATEGYWGEWKHYPDLTHWRQ